MQVLWENTPCLTFFAPKIGWTKNQSSTNIVLNEQKHISDSLFPLFFDQILYFLVSFIQSFFFQFALFGVSKEAMKRSST